MRVKRVGALLLLFILLCVASGCWGRVALAAERLPLPLAGHLSEASASRILSVAPPLAQDASVMRPMPAPSPTDGASDTARCDPDLLTASTMAASDSIQDVSDWASGLAGELGPAGILPGVFSHGELLDGILGDVPEPVAVPRQDALTPGSKDREASIEGPAPLYRRH